MGSWMSVSLLVASLVALDTPKSVLKKEVQSLWLAPKLCTRCCESRYLPYRRVLGPAQRSGVGPRTRPGELRRRPIPQRTVRPDMVVVVLPLPGQHPRLQLGPELLPLQQLVPQLAVERLRVAVL